MIRDSRLHLDPSTRRYHEGVATKEGALEASVSEAAWDAMLGPLSDAAVARARGYAFGVVNFPTEGAEGCRAAFELLSARLSGVAQTAHDPMGPILERRLARHLSARAPAVVGVLGELASIFGDRKAWRLFSDGVPVAVIDQCLAELIRPPADPRVMFESFGALRDDHVSVMLSLDERRKKVPGDDWSWLDVVGRYADEACLGVEYSLRAELVARAGPAAWLKWVASMPHPVFAAILMNHVDDLDFAQGLIEHCHEAAANDAPGLLLFALLIRRAVELWEQVDRSLVGATGLTFGVERTFGVDEVDHAEYQRWLDAWSSVELKERAFRAADALAKSAAGIDASVMSVRHLRKPAVASPAAASRVRRTYRDELLRRLAQSDVDARVRGLLGAPPTSAGLLAAVLLTSECATAERLTAVLDGYGAWLSSEGFFWNSPLEGHDSEVIDAVASALAQAAAPIDDAKTLLTRVGAVSQGWGFDLDAWFDALPRTAHVLIVAASAAANALSRSRASDAAGLMELAWNGLDSLVRDAPVDITDGRIWSTIAYVWAHASRVFQDAGTRAGAALLRLDDIQMMISAAENFTNNAGPLPIEAQRSLRSAFAARREILERHPHIGADRVAKLRETLDRITPNG